MYVHVTTFLIFDFVLKDAKDFFASVTKIISGDFNDDVSIFKRGEDGFHSTLKRGRVDLLIKLISDIMTMTSRFKHF